MSQLVGIIANQRFLGKTNPIMTAAVADGGSIQDREYIQRAARGIVDAGLWGNLKLWVDPGLVKLRNSGGVDYIPKAYDMSGNGYNPLQTTETYQPSLSIPSIVFDGSDNYLLTTSQQNLLSFPSTVFLYIKTGANITTYQSYYCYYRTTTGGLSAFAIVQTSKLRVQLRNSDNTGFITISTTNNVSTNTWYCVTIVFNADATVILYLNATSQETSAAMYSTIPNTPATIGAAYVPSTSVPATPFGGSLSSIMVFNTALTSTQITAIYNQISYRYA